MDLILFIPTSGGGAEKVSIHYANILYEKGFDILVVFISNGLDNVCQFLKPGVNKEYIYTKSKLGRYTQIIKVLLRYRPKKVFSSLTAISSILICSKLLFPYLKVITRQCFSPGRMGGLVERAIKYLFSFADVNIAQTDEMRSEMIKLYGLNESKVITINNPVDEEDIQNKIKGIDKPSVNEWKYIAVGRVSPIKDYETLIKAFKIVHEHQPSASLLIVGRPDDEIIKKTLLSLINTLGLNNKITFLDYTPNPYMYMAKSNCFVLSSISEGLPNSLVEALYLDIPCASTLCVPFVSQQIGDGINGFTAPIKDSDRLAEAMLKAAPLYGKINNTNANTEIKEKIVKTFSF